VLRAAREVELGVRLLAESRALAVEAQLDLEQLLRLRAEHGKLDHGAQSRTGAMRHQAVLRAPPAEDWVEALHGDLGEEVERPRLWLVVG
tara:strand:+ start:667 stop:936 length:270 start_codon:yes stop_codon:yes gene_type:complete